PPPCFTEAVRIADKRGTRLEALDMDEVTYTENYVDSVSGLEVVFQGRLERRLAKKRFDARTPREFVLAWDAEVNGPPGFARLQARREAFMAARLRQIAADESSVLAVIEVERTRGVLALLRPWVEPAPGNVLQMMVPVVPNPVRIRTVVPNAMASSRPDCVPEKFPILSATIEEVAV